MRSWEDNDFARGNEEDLPPLPEWTDGWQLGPPDLVLSLTEPYILSGEGPDTYRTFVMPLPHGPPRCLKGRALLSKAASCRLL